MFLSTLLTTLGGDVVTLVENFVGILCICTIDPADRHDGIDLEQ